MTAFTSISNALVAVGAKPFATTIQALRDNPVAIAEGNELGPVNSPAWHPYNMVTADDGATGLYYDVAVSGATGTVTSPTFENGYDYIIRAVGISPASGTPAANINGASVSGPIGSSSVAYNLDIEVCRPTMLDYPKIALVQFRQDGAGITAGPTFNTTAATPFLGYFAFSNFSTALTSVSLTWSTGANFDAGQFFLYRRRNYMSGNP